MYLLILEEDLPSRETAENNPRNPRNCAETAFSMVPSGTIKEVTPTGTITCLDRVCFTRRRNKYRVIGVKTHIFTTHPLVNDIRRQRRQNPPRFARVRRSGDGRSGRPDWYGL